VQSSLFVCYARDGSKTEHSSRAKSDLALESDGLELALINDTHPTWCANCQCLVSDRTPRDTLAVLLGRTVLLTVAQRFVLGARERERDKQFFAGLSRFERRNTLLPGMGLYVWCVTSGVS
jgi:hypothetical protein